MNTSTKEKIEGNIHEVVGKVKETAGNLTDNPNLKADGQKEHLDGKIHKKVGELEEVLEK